MATALQESLRSEQRFTAHVAYALRKPLTGLVTAAELLPDDELDARAEHADLTARAAGSLVKEAVARTAVPARLHMDGAEAAAQDGSDDGVTVWTDPRRQDRDGTRPWARLSG
ncbi:HAMP domain-containing histidine kinase [Streptomyces sp. 11-1-2]|uniref:HAMP domain-containing histidine kinase n=1 Tax=unclassified Streptomyces TaxID=2593676 RepID=UPI000B8D754D|nr:HAMP domain-containing histidine kinase [Streptomyces sp. 11-1-2]ASQ99824.1 hypothetical protein CGL27_48705 [Streptomyces sp. 11-1-2]